MERGKCPKCGQLSLDYGVLDVVGNIGYYPFVCFNCGCTGKEWYDFEFTEQTIDE